MPSPRASSWSLVADHVLVADGDEGLGVLWLRAKGVKKFGVARHRPAEVEAVVDHRDAVGLAAAWAGAHLGGHDDDAVGIALRVVCLTQAAAAAQVRAAAGVARLHELDARILARAHAPALFDRPLEGDLVKILDSYQVLFAQREGTEALDGHVALDGVLAQVNVRTLHVHLSARQGKGDHLVTRGVLHLGVVENLRAASQALRRFLRSRPSVRG